MSIDSPIETSPAERQDSSFSALSALPPRDSNALVTSVRDRLRMAIVLEEIPAGVRLNQVRVAEQLGVSRMPVRAASADLVVEGLLEPLPTGGVAVRSLSRRDVEEASKVREALEAQAAREVALARPEEGLKAIFAVLDRHEALGGVNDTRLLLELDRSFHWAVLDATDNPYFRRAMVPMWSVVERSMVGVLRKVPDMFDLAWKQHREIAEALAAGDADLAEQRARDHIRYAAPKLAKAIEDNE
ncbi:GntR family transcriptional regulator [Mycolicibacterium chitae]|uniref:GntR family transcriptional regulator n=1 Tax=Mycolicibacterium chitae TaxID=1792 RepID=A0A3S4RHH2_MYCCI|nr:GntR family transcriptional regulator [Mycolicibacterium chitae]BBZ01737.1 GntR family transcriptional regulator [Mycolicibacterium chitae]VEG50572.1 GntR family transcriptional regulator [Mycolicibacterium chitae]